MATLARGAPCWRRLQVEGVLPVQIEISARHGELNATTQERIREKVDKLVKFFDRVTAIHVTVDLEHRETPLVEIRLSAEHTADFVATESSSSVLASLDGALHKVERQLRKHKEKRTGHRATGLKHLDGALEPETGGE